MAIQIIQIERHRFVCGLFWQSLSRRHELRAEAIELAKKLNFDAMVLRIDRSFAGAGFASTREGAQPGLPSLGALVSKAIAVEGAFYDGRQQPAPNWLGAFSLPDERWAYFAVRDGAFLPNGDWIGTSEDVIERLHIDYSLGGWNVVIGDPRIEAHGFHNFYPRRIEDMIPRRGGKLRIARWLRLVPVARRVPWRKLAIAGSVLAVLGLAGGGAWVYRQRQLEAERERALAVARARIASQQHAAAGSTAAAQEGPHPWASAPLPSTFIDSCLDHMRLLAPGGWALDDYVCRASNVGYTWLRNESTVSMLLAAAPEAVLDGKGDHASLVVPVSMPAGGDEAPGPKRDVRIRMLSAFQMLGVPLTFTLQPPPAPPTGLAAHAAGAIAHMRNDAPPPPPAWQTWRLSAKLGELSPRSVSAWLAGPGVRLEKLSFQSGQWTVEGVVYEK